MTQHSSAEIDPTQPTAAEMPLLDRPLVADEQITVVATGKESSETLGEKPLTATAQEIRDRLFAPPDSGHNVERGLTIAHFEIEERIGSGGMGAVFRAVDTQLSRHVALKVLHPGIAADPALVARFRNEARAAAQLNHDNIARVFFTGEQDGVHFIAYEYADGKTIKQLINERGRLTVDETTNYAIQTTLALNHINTSGIVHRDIKPSNIILTKNQRIKVVDLGLARRDTTDSIGDLTVAGTTLGTFDYISPEQARDPSSADIRSDIYSLGCSLYHMLTGQPPYPEGTALQKLLDHQGKSPPDPRAISSDVPHEVSFIVQKMMNTDTELRYQAPGQLLTDLINLATDMGLRSVPAEGIVWRRIPIRRVRELSGSLFLTGAVLAICLTTLIMHFVPSRQNELDDSIPEILSSLRPPGAVTELRESPPIDVGTDSGSTRVPEQRTESTAASAQSDVASVDADTASKMVPVELKQRFLLQSAAGEATSFATLTEAWDTAKSGDVILLDFDGPLESPVRSMPRSRESRSIEIRAAAGKNPVLEFSGDEESSNRGHLFHLDKDLTLSFSGVNLRLNVQDSVSSDQWTIFECVGPNRIHLRDCVIDVINPARQNAAVIRVTDADVDTSDTPETTFRLSNTIVRGSGDLAQAAGQTNFRLNATECGFALDGSLVSNRGSADMIRTPGQIDVELIHTTSIVTQPAFRMDDSDSLNEGGNPERILPQLSVKAWSSVFAALSPDGSFVRSRGNAYLQELEELFSWSGDHNLYHNFGTYWELRSSTFDTDSDLLTFSEWTDRWQRITDAQEENAQEFDSELWAVPELHTQDLQAVLHQLPVDTFRLKRQPFYQNDGQPRYVLDAERRIPGVNSELLPVMVEASDAEAQFNDDSAAVSEQ